jgi:hypothetical protein
MIIHEDICLTLPAGCVRQVMNAHVNCKYLTVFVRLSGALIVTNMERQITQSLLRSTNPKSLISVTQLAIVTYVGGKGSGGSMS